MLTTAIILGATAVAFGLFRWVFSPPEPRWDVEPSDPDTLSRSWLRNRLPIHEARTNAELTSRVERPKSLLE